MVRRRRRRPPNGPPRSNLGRNGVGSPRHRRPAARAVHLAPAGGGREAPWLSSWLRYGPPPLGERPPWRRGRPRPSTAPHPLHRAKTSPTPCADTGNRRMGRHGMARTRSPHRRRGRRSAPVRPGWLVSGRPVFRRTSTVRVCRRRGALFGVQPPRTMAIVPTRSPAPVCPIAPRQSRVPVGRRTTQPFGTRLRPAGTPSGPIGRCA